MSAGRAAIVLGDAFALLASLPDKSVDHVITDPPYTARSTKARTTRKNPDGRGYSGGVDGTPSDPMSLGINFAFTPEQLRRFRDECVRVSRRWVLIFCELESLGLFSEHPAFVRSGIWDRHSTPQITGDRPAQPAEGIAILRTDTGDAWDDAATIVDTFASACQNGSTPAALRHDLITAIAEGSAGAHALAILHPEGRKKWNGGGKRAIYRHSVARGVQRVHPAQKPGPLIVELVNTYTDPGDRILDPCCGVGTIPAVAAGLGRDGVGFELDPRWHAKAAARVAGRADWTAAEPSG